MKALASGTVLISVIWALSLLLSFWPFILNLIALAALLGWLTQPRRQYRHRMQRRFRELRRQRLASYPRRISNGLSAPTDGTAGRRYE